VTSEALPRPRPGSEAARLVDAAERTAPPGATPLVLSGALAVLGIVCFVIGLMQDPVVTWGAVAANLLFWAGLAQGGVVVAASLHLAEARWGRLIERFALALGGFKPISVVIAAGLWFGRSRLFPWMGDRGLPPWLNSNALVLRDAGGLLVMTLLSAAFARASIRRSAAAGPLAMAVTILFFPIFGILSVDLGMSPDLRYHSTVYPVLYLSGCYYSTLAATAISVALWRQGEVRAIIPPKRVLDLGNLLWGFAIFVGYLWWCEFLVHWMGNLPDEAGRHLHLWHDWPWRIIAWGALACGVLVPSAALLSRGVKRSSAAGGLAGAVALAGILLERLLDVLPALPVERGVGAAVLTAGVCVGFAGMFAVCYLLALRRTPLFPTEDPEFVKELAVKDVEV